MTTGQNKENSSISGMFGKNHAGFENLVNELPLGIFSCDIEGNVTAVNDFLLKILGSPSAEATKKINVLTFSPLVDAGISAIIKEALKTGNETSIETPYRSAWGKELFLGFRFFPLRDENGSIVGCHAIVEDFTEKRKADAEIEKNKELLRLFIDHAPASLAMFDKDMNYLAVSRRWINDLSLGYRDIIGLSHYDVFPEIGDEWKELHRRALNGEIIIRNEDHFERADGSVQWVHWEARPWKNTEGAIGGIVIFAEDITERKKAEIALRERESLLNEVGGLAKIGGWELDPVSGNITVTPEIRRIHEIDPDEKTNHERGLSFYPPGSREIIENAIKNAIEQAEPYDLELEIISGKGNHKWVRSIGKPILEDNKVVKIRGTLQDITERKLAENKLLDNEEKLKLFIEYAPVAIIMLDRNMRHVAVSRLWIDIFSLKIEDVIGKSHYDLFPNLSEEYRDAHRRALKGEIVRKDEERYEMPDGSIRWTRWEVRPWNAVDGTIGGVIILSENITERKEVELALVAAKVEAEAANRTKTDFLANMSHELRTPLNSVIGFSEAMLGGVIGNQDPENERYLGHIYDSGKHLLTIINDIIDISRIETGNIELFFETVDVGAVIREVVTLMGPLSSKKGIVVDIDAAENVSGILVDRVKFKQIMYNLLGNAIKFTGSNGKINVNAEVNDRMLQVSVIDTGIGISEDDLDKLFTPFSQIESSISRKYGGTGLGLALVKEFVELHGGSIWVESDLGKGSNFTFEIPVDQTTVNKITSSFKSF